MAIDNARLDRPPSYEATTQSPPPEDAPKKVSALVAHEGFGDEKGTLHKEKMASNPVMNSTYATGEKPPGIAGESGPIIVNNRPNLDVKQLSRIAVDITSGTTVDKVRLFEMGSEKRFCLTTSHSIQVYNANNGALLWKVDGNSPQLEAHFDVTRSMRVSPDGTVVCVTVGQPSQRQLLIFDTRTGSLRGTYALAQQDADVPCISHDNSLVAVFHWSSGPGGDNFLKIMEINESPMTFRNSEFKKLQLWRGVGMTFAPDNRHIIIIEGPGAVEVDSKNLSVSISIYDDWTRSIVSTVDRPGPATSGFLEQIAEFRADIHCLRADQWLISFPDYHEPGQTCILNAKTGETLVSVASDRNFSQWWQAGILPSFLVDMACEEESGVFTRTEINDTVIPRGKTVTITRFTLIGARLRERALREHTGERWSRVKVVKIGVDDKCYLSNNGLQLVIVRGKTQQCDIMALPM